MKKVKYIFIVMMLVTGIILTTQATSHSPEDIQLEYNFDTQKLNVTITHNTNNPNNHYVNKVEIEKNDVLNITENYNSQPSPDTFTYNYTIETIAGDELTITAYCNLFGSITKSITITGDTQPPGAPTIDGPTSGKIDIIYDYNFTNCVDPDGDDMTYHVEWGDGGIDEGFVASGGAFTLSHIWTEKGDYTIKAKLIDIHGAESDWAYLEVTMPINQQSFYSFPLLQRLFERFPNMFPILRNLIGL
jgi:hypothetical protein